MKDKFSLDEMKEFAELASRIWALQDLKVGKPLSEKQFEAIRHYLGTAIDKFPKPKTWEIHFDQNGTPHTLHDEIEIVRGETDNSTQPKER